MPIGHLEIAGTITEIHRLVLKAEQLAASPGVNSAALCDVFRDIKEHAFNGLLFAIEEMDMNESVKS